MDERKKILLGNQDILSEAIQDIYIDLNLSNNNREIIPQKYNNVFDLTKFYQKERNQCRNFVIYGQIDSYVCDCNDLTIDVYNGEDINSGIITTTKTQHLINSYIPVYNIYGKLKGKYEIIIPPTFSNYSVFLRFKSSDLNVNSFVVKNVVEQQLIFTALTLNNVGVKEIQTLDYGLNEAVTDADGNTFEVNNDFYFFYNKHWIKKELNIVDLSTMWIGDESTSQIECLKTNYDTMWIGDENSAECVKV
jgi:hypothetical protein